jgi:hypothetical protein
MNLLRLSVLLLFLLPAGLCAQPAPKKVVPPEGTQAFSNLILHQLGLKPIKTLEELADKKPEETLIIVFGDTTVLDDIKKTVGSLEKFQGAILIASDRNDGDRLRGLNLHITGVVVTQDDLGYKGLRDCPMVLPPLNKKPHVVLQGVRQGLATNRPSVVQHLDSDFELLARYSIGCRLDGLPLPGAFLVGRERALVMGGHSVFMNMLLAQSDNDNFLFAQNCVRWLSGGKRKYALFVEEGRIVDKFDVGLTVMPQVPFPPTQVLNRLLRGLEDESFFNRLVGGLRGDRILRVLLIIVTLLLLLYGCKRLLGSRHRIEAAVPLLTPLPSPVPAVELTLPVQRQQALLKGGDFREPARELARFFFEELAQMPAHFHAGRDNLPRFSAGGGWMERRWLPKQIPYLWQLAYGEPARVSLRRFRRLPAILDRLTLAVRSGRLRFDFGI